MKTFYVTKETTETREIDGINEIDAINRFISGDFSGEPNVTSVTIGAVLGVTQIQDVEVDS